MKKRKTVSVPHEQYKKLSDLKVKTKIPIQAHLVAAIDAYVRGK